MSERIFHITTGLAWSQAQEAGYYPPDFSSHEGFIHCSRLDQVLTIANSYFAGQHGLVLLDIDPAKLISELRWESSADHTNKLFPHLYGTLNLEAVIEVYDFEPGLEGKFILPQILALGG